MGIGVLIGNIYSMGILFNYTKSMSFKNAFLVAGINIMLLSFLYFFIVKDPDLEYLKSKNQNNYAAADEE